MIGLKREEVILQFDISKPNRCFDIAVAVNDFQDLPTIFPLMEKKGIYKSTSQPLPGIILCAVKTLIQREKRIYRKNVIRGQSIYREIRQMIMDEI